MPDFDYQHPAYQQARAEAFRRSGGMCQFCGMEPAAEAHHWEFRAYKPAAETTAADLTALCVGCHDLGTMLRRYIVRGGKRAVLMAVLKQQFKGV